MFADSDFLERVLTEMRAKYITKTELAQQLETLRIKWPVIKERLSRQLLPSSEVKRRFQLVGAPVEPKDIGISTDRLCNSFFRAYHLRQRFTIIDLAVRIGCLDEWLGRLF